MKVSHRATYGILAAVDLAMNGKDVPIQARAIARRQSIPVRFLEQVLHAMKKAGLVDSTRGAQGGYLLLRSHLNCLLLICLRLLMGRCFMMPRIMAPGRVGAIRESSCCSGVCGKKCIKPNEVSSLLSRSIN